jgi:hypothetical protein
MTGQLSVEQILANLRQQLAFHDEQEKHHRQQEELHRDQRAHHAAELERLARYLETFQTAVETVAPALRVAAELEAARPPAPPPPPDDRDLGPKVKPSQAIDRVLAAWPPGAPLGAAAVTAEVNRRFAGKLRRVDVRTTSKFLQRRCDWGRLAKLREGRPFQEALYQKVKQKDATPGTGAALEGDPSRNTAGSTEA